MATPITSRPDPTEYAPFYETYIKLVPEPDILAQLERQTGDTMAFLRHVSAAEAGTRHAPYTWSVKEVVGHIIDCERIFGVRALRFARRDPTPLPGFDENPYVEHAHFDARSLYELAEEFELVRWSHIHLFRGLDGDDWLRSGVANGHPVTVRALAYIIAGHERHHVNILHKRLGR